MIGGETSGAFEAPTGLGKSLAALIPAIAHAIAGNRRTVIATYTNVLAEQYWRKDIPLALSLFEGTAGVRTQLLMGRQRYVCLTAMDEVAPDLVDGFRTSARLGIETEFRKVVKKPVRELTQLWQKVAAPPVCPGRACPAYDDCYYYKARRGSERANVVITNHSVVVSHAAMCRALDDDSGLIGKFDYLILDEAHDFPQAAINGLEFELSTNKLNGLLAVASRLDGSIAPLAERAGEGADWLNDFNKFRQDIERCRKDLVAYGLTMGRPGILVAAPDELLEHPNVNAAKTTDNNQGAKQLAVSVSDTCETFVKGLNRRMERWKDEMPEGAKMVSEATRMYGLFLREYGLGCFSLFAPNGVSVSYLGSSGQEPMLRQDIIDLADPLQEMIWSKTPTAFLSATLAIDGGFDFIKRSTGFDPVYEEILPSPFDYSAQAAIYLPKQGAIPDPTIARREGTEDAYYRAVAKELSEIITACRGRTLALFHSRKEMEGVYNYIRVNDELPILLQKNYGNASTGERFLKETHSSLFALRSFWTGFDAPGETLSCVALVRVPFEVPIDPPQIARLAWLQQQGRDAFQEHTLAQAKMMMRQGAGRLIRTNEDRGIVALLDSRIQTKRYGEQIISNLPTDMRVFRDIYDATAWIGLADPGTLDL